MAGHGAGPGSPPPDGPSPRGTGGIGPGPAIAANDPIPRTIDSPGLRLRINTMAPPFDIHTTDKTRMATADSPILLGA
jgi:hypothetical protein